MPTGIAALALGATGVAIGSGWPGAVAATLSTALLWWRAAAPPRPVPAAPVPLDPPAAGRPALHPVTGMQTREPLLAAMAEDGAGTLGLLAFKDYDRLCAFDPDAADRLLRTLTARVGAMLPPSRVVAQVDRGHLAIWIGPYTPPDQAARELDATIYALGAAVADGGGEILPEIALRHLSFNGEADTPDAALARTLASFAAPDLARDDTTQADQALRARGRFQLEQDLRQATARAELHLAYQPLIDADEGRVCGAEALLRWHRHGEPVPPSRFVPVMETAGLSREIGLWVLNAAIRQTADWIRGGLPALRVAVNVSGQQMADDDLPVVIGRTLARHGLPAAALEVELTESVALDDAGQAARLVEALRTQGVAVAIDDFGTGFSSLSTMRRLAFDKIKIDREFVTDVHRRTDSQAICQSILALGRGLGLHVLAEGVEQQAEVAWLRRHGCRYFQGFYFAPPLAPAEFAGFVGEPTRLAALLADEEPGVRLAAGGRR